MPPSCFQADFPKQCGYCKRQRRLCSTHTHTQREHGIHLHLRASISLQRSAALRGPGLLNLRLAPPSAHEGERWAVLRNWVHTILLRHLQLSREIRWTAYPGSCKWCCTEAHFDPTPLGGRCARSIPPLRVFFGGFGSVHNLESVKTSGYENKLGFKRWVFFSSRRQFLFVFFKYIY